ncbi:MAG: tripartite tricarboxylate transporter TctB family protein [Armatimonadota bacterium]|nr:tripartite tricarboxylate transporter TctB family protein [Armatimonadota bacterium]MDR7533074.1 tripartite tricarboxylate transporter TctB family protein [Armatimonadota bacterium]MDR7535894.1 tripartite tricarboxylate transporter TctB family protein [Armatimonadota bacterium]
MGWDGVVGLLLLALSVWLWRTAGEIPQPPFLPLGPDFYPRLLLALLAILAVALVAADLRAHRHRLEGPRSPSTDRRAERPEGAPAPQAGLRAPTRSRVLWTYVLFGAYVTLMPVLGFRLATFAFVAALTLVLGPRTPAHAAVSLGSGLATALLTHVIFETSLRILLPRGVW